MPGATPLTTPAGPKYPEELAQDVILPDGARIHLRPIRPDDQESLISFHDRLSSQTAYQRFFNVVKHLPATWAHFLVNVDYDRRLALVAEHDGGAGPTLVAVARLRAAEARGIRRFRASVLASNTRMLGLLTRGTNVRERHTQAGVTELFFTRRPS